MFAVGIIDLVSMEQCFETVLRDFGRLVTTLALAALSFDRPTKVQAV